MSATPEIPTYAIERLLGEGASGRVYLARETAGLRRPVALKVFSRDDRERFERELEMVGKVEEIRRSERATEIVQALGSGETPDHCYIALEYMEDGSLQDLVARQGPLAPGRALALVREAAAGLVRLHRGGIFHRDVKPANLLLGSDGHLRLGDFGLSRSLDGSLSAAGSPAFAAPEVIAGRLTDGRLADVYSLGATLAFLLTAETHLPGRPDVFALERRGVPRPIHATIVAACAAEPAERLASVEVLLLALDGHSKEIAEEIAGTKSAPRDVPPRGDAPMTPAGRTDMISTLSLAAPRLLGRSVVSLLCGLSILPAFTVQNLTLSVLARDPEVKEALHAHLLAVIAFLYVLPIGLTTASVVLGTQARARVVASAGALSGRGLATAGIVIASLSLAVAIGGPVLALLLH